MGKKYIDRIEVDGGFDKAPIEYNNDESFAWSSGYVCGATKEFYKAEGLVEALEKVLEKHGYQFVKDALTKYKGE